MSPDEIVGAYAEGQLSRRAFIRRLVAGGVSLGAAASYAHLLAPGRAEADARVALNDFYPKVETALRSRSLERVIDTGRIRILLDVNELTDVELVAAVRHRGRRRVIGRRSVHFDGPGSRLVRLRLTQRGRNILQSKDAATLKILAIASDLDDPGIFDTDTAKRRLS